MDVNFALTSPSQWARDALSSRSNNLMNPGKGPWATQRKPWIRAISGAKVNGGYTLRNQYILFTGTQTTFDNSYDAAFFRPRIGITSMELDFKGTMGSTRSVTLNFQCWTKTDLEALEKVYMIPGMSIIVEWGWSVTPEGVNVNPIADFLDDPSSKDGYMSEIMKKVIAAREQYAGNYDGFIGVVTNFNYSLNQDLGFDCTIEIVGAGEMFLEHAAINNSGKCKESTPEPGKSKSNVEFLVNEFYKKGNEDDKYITDINTKDDTTSLVRQIWEIETREADKSTSAIGKAGEFIADAVNTARESWEVYISWGKFVATLNSLLGKLNEDTVTNTSNSTMNSKSNGSNPKLGLHFIPVSTLPKLMSADPRICIFKPHNVDKQKGKARQEEIELSVLNEPPTQVIDSDNVAAKAVNATFEVIGDAFDFIKIKGNQLIRSAGELPGFDRNGELFPANGLPSLFDDSFAKEQINKFGDADDIYEASRISIAGSPYFNIGFLNSMFINCAYLRDLLQNSEDNLNVEDFLSKVLSDLNDCCGNLWNLQYVVSEKYSNKLMIYDANYTSLESRNPDTVNPYRFSVSQTLPLKVTVESKLVDGFKEMVLYDTSATDNGTTNAAGNKQYAAGVEDGYKTKSTFAKCPEPTDAPRLAEKPDEDVDAAYYLLLGAVDDESVAGAKNALKQYIKFLEEKPDEFRNIPKNNNILLPFHFTIDIDGFSGLVWGNAIGFDYLPSRYDDQVFFQVTKLKHSLNPEQWITSIETIMRVINKEATQTGTTIQQSQQSKTPGYSPAPVNVGTPPLRPSSDSAGSGYLSDKPSNSPSRTITSPSSPGGQFVWSNENGTLPENFSSNQS